MKKRLLIIGVLVLTLMILAVWAVPAFADGASNSGQTTQNTRQVNKARLLVRILMIRNEAKVDAFLAKAESAGKLNADQVKNIKQIWTNHHEQFERGSILIRLLKANNGTNVRTVLEKAVAAGKIKQRQADRIMALWQKLHNK